MDRLDVLVEEMPGRLSAAHLARLLAGRAYPFWLDSGGDHPAARLSFLGSEPYALFRFDGFSGRFIDLLRGSEEPLRGDPFSALAGAVPFLQQPLAACGGRLPFPFCGGAVGFFGYGVRRYVEPVPVRLADDVGLPEAWFACYDAVFVFDAARERAWLACPQDERGRALSGRPVAAVMARGRDLWRQARQTASTECEEKAAVKPEGSLQSSFARDAYLRAVERCLQHIAAGDIFQANLSQRFSTTSCEPPFELYLRLRRLTPAPFAAYVDGGDFQILSASPERFLRLADQQAETRPIKGTRPRGRTPEDDRRYGAELTASEKDRAEHVMIVDVERNDLGRFCLPGTVQVPELAILEAHPTVFHLVSTVTGHVRPGMTALDCIRSAFPGGSITGAPKVRAMEIIDELEPVARGVYTGAIGYLGVGGSVDLNIAIRTLIRRANRLVFHVGGGIVADSDPEAEYEETLDKAVALMAALGVTAPGGRG